MQPGHHLDNHAAMLGQFRWSVPRHFNIAQVCAKRWATHSDGGQRVAVLQHQLDAAPVSHTYAQLQASADALSHALHHAGVKPGDRVAVVLPQRFETAVAYVALWQMGVVVMPLSQLFGPEALAFRLQDAQAVLALVDAVSEDVVRGLQAECPALRQVFNVAGLSPGVHAAWPMVDTLAQDPAVLIYTSGTTGPPKGALIPHRALIGNLTGFVCSQNWFGFAPHGQAPVGEHDLPLGSHAVMWSPADWTWTGGLMDALLPSLYFGRPIVAWSGRFSADLAFGLMQQHRVTHTFLFPTALKAMMKAYPQPALQFQLDLQAIMSAGEAVGDAVFAYCQNELGVTVNEMFGQTEVNYIVGNCAMNGETSSGVGWPARAGSMGRAYPGHRVAVIDEDGHECAVGVPGDVALHRFDLHGDPDPIFFLGYWRQPEATAAKYSGDWCRTGDLATRDADGYLWYQGRADDVFKAAGYRIGPSEIENCLVKHPAVANAAVVPKPDAERGNLVKAYVVLAAGFAASDDLVAELQQHVRGLLAPYEYPKEIEFIDALPMTTTGKVQRRVLRLQEAQRAHTLKLRPMTTLNLTPVRLGQSDLHVTPICLGTMTFGQQVDEATSHTIMDHSVARGVNFFDTAEMYAVPPTADTFGFTETYIGNWLSKRPGMRNNIVLATKVAGPSRGMPWVRAGEGMTAADILASCDASLKRLKTDVIDLYQIHWPERHVPIFGAMYYDPTKEKSATPIHEQLEALGKLVKAGKVRCVGLSNETSYGVHEFVRLAEQHGLPRVASVQNVYCLVNRILENGLDETMHRLDVSLLAYSPLGFGLLTGKYDASGITGDAAPKEARITKYDSMRKQRWGRPDALAAARQYNALAQAHGMTPTQLALAFCYHNWRVASTIIGVTSLAQLDENLNAWGTQLSPEVLAAIDAIRWDMRDPAI